MGTYELDDDKVRRFLDDCDGGETRATVALVEDLQAQVPTPVPQGIGAVVETDFALNAPGLTVFVRWAHDNQTTSPWIAANNHEHPYRTMDIGRIVTILSDGAELR